MPYIQAMKQKVCLITGATSGIGKEVALGMAKRGYQIVVIGRNAEKGTRLESEIKQSSPNCSFAYYLADMSDLENVKAVSAEILAAYPVIDVLVNNAGGVFSSFELTAAGVERTMANNHLGYFISTLGLLPALAKSADPRVIIVSSATHYQAELDFESFHQEKKYQIMKAYGQSKLANVMFTYALDRRLKGSPIKANVIHPGVVKTPIGRKAKNAFHRFAWNVFALFKGVSPATSAENYFYLAATVEGGKHRGQYFHDGVHQPSSDLSYDESIQEKLWTWSVEQTGVDLDPPLLAGNS